MEEVGEEALDARFLFVESNTTSELGSDISEEGGNLNEVVRDDRGNVSDIMRDGEVRENVNEDISAKISDEGSDCEDTGTEGATDGNSDVDLGDAWWTHDQPRDEVV